jgi:hypothetical protein
MEDTAEEILSKVKTDILESVETVLGHEPRKHSSQLFASIGEKFYRKNKKQDFREVKFNEDRFKARIDLCKNK